VKLSAILLGGIVLGALAVAIVGSVFPGIRSLIPNPFAAPPPSPPFVRTSVQAVNKAVYAEQGMMVITETQEGWGPFVRGKVIIATANCTAGMDYDKKDADVVVKSSREVSMSLPNAEILGCGTTAVKYIDKASIIPIPLGADVSNRLYEDASQMIKAQAKESDLVAKASSCVMEKTELGLRRLGFEKITVETTGGR
jgi:hypothetical protein